MAIGISIILFTIPFFWLKPGFVDLGGDGGRLEFINAFAAFQFLYSNQNAIYSTLYSLLPYQLFMSLLHSIVSSLTIHIAVDHGIQLSLSFYSFYLLTRELLTVGNNKKRDMLAELAGIISGVVYIGFVSNSGWSISLITQNQIFLNPLICYLLLRLVLTGKFQYTFYLLLITLFYSGSFGYTNMPQIMSFFPLAFLFLLLLFVTVYKKTIPWKSLSIVLIAFFGLHAFHLIPMIGSILDSNSHTNAYIFYSQSDAVWYFDQIREQYGIISTNIFQPANWNTGTIFALFVPLTILLAFFRKASKLLSITAIFLLVTLFLVSANITNLGTQLYRMFFEYIPGFIMFRSFYEKWYFVYAFFYALLLGLSFYILIYKKRFIVSIILGTLLSISVIVRIIPFFQGSQFKEYLWQSNSIPKSFDLDPDLMTALSYVQKLPYDGNFFTLPLTLPYYQVVMGKTSGAYVGISMINSLGGKKDYSGFWSFRPLEKEMLSAFENNDATAALQILSLSNIKYVFRNTDERIFQAFHAFPFYKYDSTLDIPILNSQKGYDQFLNKFPMTKVYEKGYFQIQELDQKVLRPTIYFPDVVNASLSGVLAGTSFRSAYLDTQSCEEKVFGFVCGEVDSISPTISFKRNTSWQYDVSIDVQNREKPFLLVLSDDYHPSWTLSVDNKRYLNGIYHVKVNGYANGWIIDPKKSGLSGKINGSLYLGFQQYYVIGRILSGITLFIILVLCARELIKHIYEKK